MSTFFEDKFFSQDKKKVVVLPDFFLDVIINPNSSFHEFLQKINTTFTRGGGNFVGPTIDFHPGGNGGNVALTTNQLNMETFFLGETSELGIELIKFYFRNKGVKIYFSSTGELASSFILEFSHKNNKQNVMVSSTKSLRHFGPEKLTETQQNVILKADFVIITNFQNYEFLNLLKGIFSQMKNKQVLSIDFSDITPHKNRIDEIHECLHFLSEKNFIIAGNENEFKLLLGKDYDSNFLEFQEIIIKLSYKFPNIFFCLHTSSESFIANNKKLLARKPTIKLSSIVRATGAGDAWHGGLIKGISLVNKTSLKNVTESEWEDILLFANFVGGFWVANGVPGSLTEIKKWLSTFNMIK